MGIEVDVEVDVVAGVTGRAEPLRSPRVEQSSGEKVSKTLGVVLGMRQNATDEQRSRGKLKNRHMPTGRTSRSASGRPQVS